MKPVLTFIIPVRHPDNCKNWPQLKRNLADTVRSVAAQDHPGWQAVIVANQCADLPLLPPGFTVKRVDFPPNPLYERGQADRETFYEQVRLDKGRRLLAGLLHARPGGHVMTVDDDDFVCRRLTAFVARHPAANGWYIQRGYVWGDGGRLLYRYDGFSHFCGTSHLIRADLYRLPDCAAAASDDYIKRLLGSHLFIRDHLERKGTPLAPLPMIGAIYRIGHAGAHSQSENLIAHFFLKKWLLKKPPELARRLFRLRLVTRRMREEFYGESRNKALALPWNLRYDCPTTANLTPPPIRRVANGDFISAYAE